MATPVADMSQPLVALENLLATHSEGISWHLVLNNHTSTKPQSLGGKMFHSLTELKQFERLDGGLWRCRICMPCSFQHGDGIVCDVEAIAPAKQQAGERACFHALVRILSRNAAAVRLMSKHWNIPVNELLERINQVLHGEHQPLPVNRSFYPPPQASAYASSSLQRAPAPGSAAPAPWSEEVVERVAELLRLFAFAWRRVLP